MRRFFTSPTLLFSCALFIIITITCIQTPGDAAVQNDDDDFLLLMMPAIIAAHQASQYDPNNPHASIRSWNGTSTCLKCHQTEGEEVFHSTHYQWLGDTPYMTNGPDIQ